MRERLARALDGRYEIERQLGEGGMAIVYLAFDIRHDRRVALKVLRPELAATMGPERFLKEIRVTAKLQHPHILPLFESGEADGFLYYVMPFLHGESLRDRLARESELPVDEAVGLLRGVVDALAAAHAAGVVHRDIKPDNVMLSGRHAVVADFGVAKAVSEAAEKAELTTEGVALGTPAYMAPEQAAANEHIDHRADIYAVGAMAYELLGGRPPFTGMTAQQVLAAHVTQEPRPVTELRASVPPALGAVIMRCLAKKPADRWQSAEELLAQLDIFQTPAAGVTPTRTQPVATGGGVSGWLKMAAPLAVAALIGGGIWLFAGGGLGPASEEPSTAAAGDVPVEDQERLIVMPLRNLTDDPELDVWGRLAADEMARAVDVPRPIPVIPSTTVGTTIRGLGENATTEAVAGELLATHAFAGTVAEVGGRIRFDIELIDVRTGERLRTLDPFVAPMEEAPTLVAELAAAAATVAVTQLSPNAPPWVASMTPPVSLAAFEAYMEQVEIFCEGDNRGSLEPAYRALELSPDYVAAMGQAMVAHSNLGEDAIADSLIEELNGMRDAMSRPERLMLDWMIGNRRGDPGLARRAADELYRIDPVGAGTTAMLTSYRQRRMEEAIERYRMGAPAIERCPWPSRWLQGAVAFHTLGRLEEELALAREGLEYYPDHREMMDIEVRVMAAHGRMEGVDSLLAVMENLPPQDGYDPALRGIYAGLELIAHGYRADGERVLSETVADLSDSSPANQARAYYWAGRYEKAAARFEELLEGDPDNATYLWMHGASLARLDRDEEARDMIERLGALDPANQRGYHIWGQGLVAAALGEKDQAVALLQSAFDNGRLYNIWVHREPALADMWGYGPFDALMAPR